MSKMGWAVGIATGVAITFAAWLVGGWGGESTVRVVDDLGLVGFAVFAAVCAGLAARSARDRQRAAWICLTVGLAGWALGEAIWAYYQLVLGMEESPFPSVADVAYLLFPVGACLALVLFPSGYSGQSRTRLLLDGLIIAGALFEICWVIVLQDVYEAGAASRFALGVSMAYPVTDIVVVAVALLVLVRARTGQRMTLALLTLGSVLNSVSDSAFVYLIAQDAYDSGNVIDVGWVASLLVLSMAALVSRQAAHVEKEQKAAVPSRASMWLPYLPLVPATVVCGPKFMPTAGLGPIVVTTLFLVMAVLLRQFCVVGENRRLLKMVSDQAFRDPLTGLANRALFHDRLTHAMQIHQRDRQPVVVLSLDLDDFKLVNDSLGHPAGDALLVLAAERLLGCVRTGDTVARLGGDEFAILMEGMTELSRLVAHRVMQAFDEPFIIDGHDLLLRPSVGLAVALADDVDISADVLLKQVDVAMYSAKRSRTGGVHTFSPDMQLIDPREAKGTGRRNGAGAVRLLGQLRHAIDHDGLSVVYQPKFDLRSGEIAGVEALVRWPHPELGMLGPDQFLPLVRQHGLMRAVTELVLARALDDAADWKARGLGVPVAINLFAPTLGSLDLPTKIADALAARGLGPGDLTVEITEDLFLDDFDRSRTVLERLRAHGVRIAIDDFGSGYSALCYLRDLPIDELKLDKQFIAPILMDAKARAVVRAVVDLAHVLGVTTVAEGVENADTASRLREYGCDVVQGFHYSPPVGAEDILELLSEAVELPWGRRVPVSARSS
jgi:diguanylate cyclase (GGDEF)-like protein